MTAKRFWIPAGSLIFGLVAVAGAEGPGDGEALLRLNERVLHSYVVENDTGPLEAIALPEMQVLTPGGLEDLDQVVATVTNLDVDEMRIEDHAVKVTGDAAIVTGIMILKGRLGSRPAPPKLGFMTTFVKRDGEWHQLARSLVPLGPPPGMTPGSPAPGPPPG